MDVFGGSGLLAHTAKRTLPKARVIYNDFDGYAERIKNIPDTNRLRDRLAEVLDKQPRDKALNADAKAAVVVIIRGFGGYKDLNCLRSWLLYSGKEASTPKTHACSLRWKTGKKYTKKNMMRFLPIKRHGFTLTNSKILAETQTVALSNCG